ncbi:short-chain dehydrogenase [Acuticoccus sediminis]|uniref:Short-chain dehydrogenase n=1 Tax=Acuticoccus sediminis TaxID=2184697 RepID=A0A8B2NSY9_9HYPH|nr:SDR family NAD(P)-dependent oxidoreductase [Acuticoccus sediminis]RAI01639.1 short-chain dehydrogenase [Acuticoccus sediminis]
MNRLALVTGAARGIGRAIAERLAADGFTVVAADRDLPDAADGITPIRLDVTDRLAVKAALTGLDRPVDVLVNNAGVYSDRPFMELTEADFEAMLAVNLMGVFIVSQEVLRSMPDGGRIVTVSSRSYLGARNMGHYGASKAAVVALTRTMAIEFADRDIAVNAIAPGLVETSILDQLTPERRADLARLQPTGRLGQPQDIAAAAAYLAAPATQFITGQVLIVDGGKSLGGVWM